MNRLRFAIKNGLMITTIALLSLSSVPPVYATSSPPVVVTDSGSAAFVAGDNTTSTPVTIDSGLTVTGGSSSTLASATVSITGNLYTSEDVLSFTNTGSATDGNISASYNASTGVLTLTSSGATATLAEWQAALDAVTYTDTAVTPNNATRTISFTVVDASAATSNTATRTVTVTDTDQTPIVTTTGGTTNYVSGTSAAPVDGGVTVSDLDNTTQSSATVSISSGFHSGDTLTFVDTNSTTFGNIVGSYNSVTGVLTLTSSGAKATDAQWSNALSAVSFSSSSQYVGARTVSFTVNDGTKNSAAQTDTVDVLGPPTITTDSGSAAFVAGDNTTSTPVTIDSGLTVTDGTATTLASAIVSITGNLHTGEDVLSFTNTTPATFGTISASYNASTGVLTLASSGATTTLAEWQAALDAVTYTDTAVTPNNATRTISFTVVDASAATSNTATRTVAVTDTDQTPIVTTTGGTTNYVRGTSAATVDGGVAVSDLDNATQSGATVSISSGFHSGDILTFANPNPTTFGNIVGTYNSATGVLTMTSSGATATDAQWSNALSAVSFSSSSQYGGARTVSFTVNDGTKNSAAQTDTVDVLSSDANLSNLTVDQGILSPAFNPATTSYSETVTHSVSSVQFTLASEDANATVTVNGQAQSGSSAVTVPLNDGSNTITIEVTAQSGATQTYTIVVNRQSPSIGPGQPFISTFLVVEDAKVGLPYTQGISAVGGTQPYHWLVTGGELPRGLTLSDSGIISGTPTGLGGQYTFIVQVVDANHQTATRQLTMTVDGPTSYPTISTTRFTSIVVGKPYSQTLSATGGSVPYTWRVAQGVLPFGMTLNPQTGTLAGTSTTGGQTTVTVQVTDSYGNTATQMLTLNALKPNQRAIVWDGKVQNVPAIVGNDSGTQTTYMPIWYVMQWVKSVGIQSKWDGQAWKLTTTAAVNTSNIHVGRGNTSIYVNGTLIQDVNTKAATDPSTGHSTTYMPIYYVEQILKRVGLTSTWDGTTWTVAPTTVTTKTTNG
ncbi:cadherin-like beta sandwich domain-containing protein [Alicyclobacillus curvatus]|nr:cadherin-like beta sandwich domain-containing protein [Alicyclobacillus curvatus]